MAWQSWDNLIMLVFLLCTLPTLLAQAQNAPGAPGGAPGGPSRGGGTHWLAWAMVMLGLAVVLFLIEVLVPSGGLIGVLAAVSLIAGIIMLCTINTTLGLVTAIVSLIALPFLIAFAIKIWPDTPIGRMLTLQNEQDPDTVAHDGDEGSSEDARKTQLPAGLRVGQVGQAITDLRPVGMCLFDGKREPCTASVSMIRAGTPVQVVNSDGMEVRVRPRPEP